MKRTDKKNQHYIPKFLLRYFSFENNLKEIGVYTIDKTLFIRKAKLKTQASKKFFYGKDGLIEDFLGDIESMLAPIFLKIKNQQDLPTSFSENHVHLLHFLILLDMRNPNRKAHYEGTTNLFKEYLESSGNPNVAEIQELEDSDKRNISFLRMIIKARDLIAICMDLKYKILKNETLNPFITSDNPLVKYNQFLEKRKWKYGSHNGFGNIGAQWFIPIDDEYTLIFYDPNIYKVGNKKENVVSLTDKDSIDKLNILQLLNATQNIFFNHKANKGYIDSLAEKSIRFEKPNQVYSDVYRPAVVADKKEKILFYGITDLKINLELQKIKMNSKSKYLKFEDHIIQLRPRAKEIREYQKKNTPFFKNLNSCTGILNSVIPFLPEPLLF